MEIVTRNIAEGDAAAVAGLSAQLGYVISAADTARQITLMNASANDDAYVAVYGDVVVGWVHVFYGLRLESGSFCEVGGLVVDEQYRGRGIGKLLLARAAEWCAARQCNRLVVRSNAKRKEAHAFYAGAGYEEVKEQKVFKLRV